MTEATLIPMSELDDRPGVMEQDSADRYVTEKAQRDDQDVLAGLREVDGADGVTWKIYRMGADDEKENGWIADLSTVQLSMQTLANKFGPGNYRVRGQYTNGTYAGQRTVKIASDAHRAVKDNAVVNASSGGGFNMQEFFAAQEVREEARRRQEEIDRDRRRKDRLELLTVLAPVMAAAIPALLGRSGPDIGTLISALKPPDPIATLTALKALNEGSSPKQDPIDAALKLMDKLQDLSGGGGETGWLDIGKEVVRAVGPTLGPVIEGAIQKASAPAISALSATGVLPIAVPFVSTTSAPVPENPQMFGMLQLLPWLRGQMEMALQKAQGGSDPGLIAERILDDLPKNVDTSALHDMLSRPDWFQQLQRFDARVAAFGPWFTQMRQAMMEEISGTNPTPLSNPQPVMTVTPVSSPQSDEIQKPEGPPKLGL